MDSGNSVYYISILCIISSKLYLKIKYIQNYWVFIFRPSVGILRTENTTFRKLDLFPSSCERGTPTLLGLLERAKFRSSD
jgi:hypothetical protein